MPQVEQLETRLAPATIATVNTNADANALSPSTSPAYDAGGDVCLRSAIQYANSGNLTGTIAFTSSFGTQTIALASALGNLPITDTGALTIDGTGASITVKGLSSGVANGGIFAVSTTSAVTINNLTLTGGNVTTNGGALYITTGGNVSLSGDTFSGDSTTSSGGAGGAVYLKTGTLTIADCTFSGNSANNGGGAVYMHNGTLTVTDCTFSGNTATGNNGSGGGIHLNSGTLKVTDSTFSSNKAASRSGGAVYANKPTTTLTNDTFSNNKAGSFGGAVYNHGTLTLTDCTFSGNNANRGGGLASLLATAIVTESTFNGNSATTGGAVYSSSNGNLQLASDTIAGNSVTATAGGVYIGGGTSTSLNTILDGNTKTGGYSDVKLSGATLTSSGGNLYGTTNVTTWKTASTAGSLYPDVHDTADNPMLGSLAGNGGYTQTMAPLSGSPALGAGNVLANAQTTDQRGFLRVVNNKIDIGAFENQSQFFTLTPPGSNPDPTAGTAATFNLGSFSEIVGSSWTASVSWGDGTKSTPTISGQGAIPATAHTYYAPGSYTVTVTLTDGYGNFNSMTFGVTVGGNLTVTTLSDVDGVSPYSSPVDKNGNGEISLRSALEYANANGYAGTIGFTSGLRGTISIGPSGVNSALTIIDSNALTIDGTGAAITVSGENKVQDFSILTTSSVTINDLTITNGYAHSGGGISVTSGSLTLSNDTITKNNTANLGNGAGIWAHATTLTLTDDTISNNTAAGGGTGGGIYANAGTLTATDCTIADNYALTSAGGTYGRGGGVFSSYGNLTFTDTTFNGNTALSGGGIYGSNFTLTLTSDTLYGNSATNGGGVFDYFGTVKLENSTVSGNSASATGRGGGIYVTGTTGYLTTFDSILDGNTAATNTDVYFAGTMFTSSGGNLYGNKTGTETNVTWNTSSFNDVPDPNDNPGLGSLQNNGGSTQTLAELPGSLAYQSGLLTGKNGATPPSTDQRGLSRESNGKIDIGAFQNQAQWFSLSAPANQTATAGSASSFGLGSFSYTGSAGNLWTVTVGWGDGTQSTFSTTSQGTLPAQGHTYAAVGVYTLTVTVTDLDNNFAQTNTATVTVGGTLVVNTTQDLAGVGPSYLTPYTNTSTPGNLQISLRSALQFVNQNNVPATILFQPGLTGPINIGSTGGTLPVSDTSALTIDAKGATITVNGNGLVQVLNVSAGTQVAIDDLTITGGSSGSGGGVYNAGNLSLNDCTLTGNAAGTHGGALDNAGTAILTACTLSGNSSSGGAGAISNDAGTLTLNASTLSGNTAAKRGGAIANNSIATLTNCTLFGNMAGIAGGAIENHAGTMTLASDTLAGNKAGSGGGIDNTASLTVFDTIVAGNTGGDISGAFGGSNNVIGVNPLLGPLQNNGGPTQTMAELPGSPALGAGTTSGVTYTTDQRGFQRIVNNQIDAGAFENQSQLFKLSPPASPQSADAGTSTAFNLGSFSYSGSAGNVFKVDVSWGDGSADTIFTVVGQGSLGTQNHTYANPTSGTPYTIRISVIDTDGNFGQTTGAVKVSQALAITTTSIPAGVVNAPYPQTLIAVSGGQQPYNFSTTGSLDGLTLSSRGGLEYLDGSPASAGTFTFTIIVTDANKGSASQTYTLVVSPTLSLTVNTTADTDASDPTTGPQDSSGNISLLSALEYVNTNSIAGTINFIPGLTGTIRLAPTPGNTAGNLELTDIGNLTIDGSGAKITVDGSKLSGITQGGVFCVCNPAADAFRYLTITGGSATNSGGGVYDGGTGSLALDNVTLNNNSAANGGGIFCASAGNVTLTNDTISGNTATNGAGIDDAGSNVTLTNCYVASNIASGKGGGILVSGSEGSLTVANSTIAHNSATSGGGLYNTLFTLLTSTTIANNSAQNLGGGIYNFGGGMTVGNTTIAYNSAGNSGGGIYNTASFTTGSINVVNTIVDGNTAAGIGKDVFNGSGNTFSSTGGNLFGAVNGTVSGPQTGDQYDAKENPGLGALQNNGGPTPTLAELPGSLALGNGLTAGAPATDQRGFQRVVLLSPPAAPTLSFFGPIKGFQTTYNVQVTYLTATGETLPSTGSSLTAGTSNSFVVDSPAAMPGATGYNVYVNSKLQNASPLAIGTNWTVTSVVSGSPPPRSSTALVTDIGAFQNQSQWFNITAPAKQSAIAGSAASFNLGSFTYTGSAGSPWTITVNWGDNTQTVFSASQGILPAQIHTYSTIGDYTLTITVTDLDNNFGQSSSAIVAVGGTITVNTLADKPGASANTPYTSGGLVSLRSALDYFNTINAPGTIGFQSRLNGTINLAKTLGNLQITDSNGLTIDGTGASITVSGAALTGISRGGVFYLETSAVDAIDNLTITGGSAGSGGGGGIYNSKGNLTLNNDTITGNTASACGGGIYNSHGNLTLNNDTLASNKAGNCGGGIYNSHGNLTLNNVTFLSNSANLGGGINNSQGNLNLNNVTFASNNASSFGGGIYSSQGNLAITGSTFSANTAGNGGGIYATRGSLTLSNSTVANNMATSKGGGIYATRGSLTLSNSTIAGNSAKSGGGIYRTSTNSGLLTIYDTILDGNTASTGADLLFTATGGTFTSSGGNLYGSSSGVTWKTTGTYPDIQSNRPGLGALQNNGGPTQTIALLSGSPALAAGNPVGAPATDQRGFQRVVNGKIDIGAFENQALSIAPSSLPNGTAGTSYIQFLTGSGGSGGYSFTLGTGTLPTGLTLSSTGLLSGTPTSTNGGAPFTFTVQVTDSNNNSTSRNYNVSISPGAPAHVTATAGSGQSVLVSTTFGTNLSATVTDGYGNPVPNVTVVFAAPSIGFSGTFAGSASVTTNGNGVATAPAFTANLLAGTYTVTASVSGVSGPAGFTLANLSPLGTSGYANFVENVYGLLLSRVADSGAVAWVNQLAAGTAPSIVVQEIEASGEYLTDVVRALYQHYLNRTGSSAEWQGWVSMLAGGTTIEQVAADIVASPEFYSSPHEGGGTNAGFMQALYQYVLGRAGSSAEIAAWVNGYNLSDPAVRDQVALAFLTSQEYRTDLLVGGTWTPYVPVTNWGGYYPEFLRRPADPLGVSAWLQQFQAGLTDQAILAAIFASNEGYAKWS